METTVDLEPPRSTEPMKGVIPGPRDLTVRSYGLTDKGRVRQNNEDQFLVADVGHALHVQHASLDEPPVQLSPRQGHLFLVADGMGGHQAGERARALAVGMIERCAVEGLTLQEVPLNDGHEVLRELDDAIQLAHRLLTQAGEKHPEWDGMGTTLTLAYNLGDRVFVVHAGDSRCYLWREEELQQLTSDHTLTAEMLEKGILDADEARRHRYRHIVTNSLGGKARGVQVEAHDLRLEPGDGLLLCSDGLTEMVDDAGIATILKEAPEPRDACERLVSEANLRGGRDNITVIVARFD